MREEATVRLAPEGRPGGWVKGVVGRLVAEQLPPVHELAPVVATRPHGGPDGHHEPHAKRVKLAGHAERVRETHRVERLLAPGVASPRLPVQHDAVQRQPTTAVLAGDGEQVRLALIPLLRLHVAEGPPREHGRRPGQRPELSHDLVEARPEHHVVVQLLVDVAPEIRPEGVVVESDQRGAVEEDAVAAGRHEDRHGHLEVLLVEVLVLAAEVEHALLVRAQPVQGLPVGKAELELRVERRAVNDLPDAIHVDPHAVDVLAALMRGGSVELRP